MTDNKLHMAGIAVTVAIHLGVGVAITAASRTGGDDEGPKLAERQVIEAALAFKKVEKKTRQPQKKSNPKVAPKEAVGVSRDADKEPEPPKEKDREPPPPDFVDPSATLKKFRQIDIDEAPNEVEEDEQQGSDEGSEWGTAEEAKGHPYVAELAGRIQSVWSRPTLDTGGGEVLGCVRLSKAGKVVDGVLDEKSKNSTLNRSVEEALRKVGGMPGPVPESLKELLTERGICFRFSPGD